MRCNAKEHTTMSILSKDASTLLASPTPTEVAVDTTGGSEPSETSRKVRGAQDNVVRSA